MSAVRSTAFAVLGHRNGQFTASSESHSLIQVQWLCGDRRSFSPELIAEIIDCIDRVTAFPDVWFQGKDLYSDPFVACVRDGRLHVERRVTEATEHSDGVDWEAAKKALKAAVKSCKQAAAHQAERTTRQDAERAAAEAEASIKRAAAEAKAEREAKAEPAEAAA